MIEGGDLPWRLQQAWAAVRHSLSHICIWFPLECIFLECALTPHPLVPPCAPLACASLCALPHPNPPTPHPPGEDFSFYCRAVPCTLGFLGTRNEALGSVHALHNPRCALD